MGGLKFIINSKVEISWNDGYYKSSIEDVDGNLIAISIPIKDGEYLPLNKGEKIDIIYFYLNDIYKFQTMVVNRKADRIPLLQIDYPKEVFKIQRRKFVRVPIICSINYERLSEVSDASRVKFSNESKPIFKATMVDLSGGGAKIRLKETVKSGDILIVHVPMEKETITLKGEVTRVEKSYDNRLNTCGIEFSDLDERTREKLIRIVFQIMREQMKKGSRGD